MTTNSPKEAVEARIYELAEQHGVVAERVPLDDWADKGDGAVWRRSLSFATSVDPENSTKRGWA